MMWLPTNARWMSAVWTNIKRPMRRGHSGQIVPGICPHSIPTLAAHLDWPLTSHWVQIRRRLPGRLWGVNAIKVGHFTGQRPFIMVGRGTGMAQWRVPLCSLALAYGRSISSAKSNEKGNAWLLGCMQRVVLLLLLLLLIPSKCSKLLIALCARLDECLPRPFGQHFGPPNWPIRSLIQSHFWRSPVAALCECGGQAPGDSLGRGSLECKLDKMDQPRQGKAHPSPH